MLEPFLDGSKERAAASRGKAAARLHRFRESSLVSRPVKPLRSLNGCCHRRGVRRARLHRGGRIPGRCETVLRKSPVEEDVPCRGVAALGLIRDAAAHQYKRIDVITDVDPAAGAALRDHGD
jgi:hypothetical protein